MSMPPPPNHPDDPTPPTQPLGAPDPYAGQRGYARERVVEQVVEPEFDPRFALASIEDSLRSLRTAVALLGIVSVAALALGGYALIRAIDADENDRVVASDGGSESAQAALQERVDDLERALERSSGDAAESGDVDDLREAIGEKADAADVRALQGAVDEVRDQAAQPDEATAQAVADLAERVDALEQQAAEQQQQQP